MRSGCLRKGTWRVCFVGQTSTTSRSCRKEELCQLRFSQLKSGAEQVLLVGMANQSASASAGFKRFLPRIGSPAYHLMLACVAILILGPLGGISAAFMNFSIGFFISGQ